MNKPSSRRGFLRKYIYHWICLIESQVKNKSIRHKDLKKLWTILFVDLNKHAHVWHNPSQQYKYKQKYKNELIEKGVAGQSVESRGAATSCGTSFASCRCRTRSGSCGRSCATHRPVTLSESYAAFSCPLVCGVASFCWPISASASLTSTSILTLAANWRPPRLSDLWDWHTKKR